MKITINMSLCASTGPYWADAASIGPVQARYWQQMACLQGLHPYMRPRQTRQTRHSSGPITCIIYQHGSANKS